MKKYILLGVLCLFVLAGCESVDLKEKKSQEEQRQQQAEIQKQLEAFNAVKSPKKSDADTADQPVAGPALSSEGMTNDSKNNETKTMSDKEKQEAAIAELAKINQIVLQTNKGDIVLEFYKQEAPNTCINFANLAKQGFYNGTKFHRVIKDFMIQGGDPNSRDGSPDTWGRGGPGYKFADEINAKPLVRGTLAMANSGPNTNGSQFFIVTADSTPWLDGKHTAFGQVVAGMDVVDAINETAVNSSNQPLDPVIITNVVVK